MIVDIFGKNTPKMAVAVMQGTTDRMRRSEQRRVEP